jgi:hypothetical protein
LNGTQAIIATLIFREVENRRKRPQENDPPYLPYASHFISLLIGEELLTSINISDIIQLDHRIFEKAKQKLTENNFDNFYKNALSKLEKGIEILHPNSEDRKMLQKLSATFRRYDLLDKIDYPIIKNSNKKI